LTNLNLKIKIMPNITKENLIDTTTNPINASNTSSEAQNLTSPDSKPETPKVINKKHPTKKIACIVLVFFLFTFIIAFIGGFGTLKLRDWLRSQQWYLCVRSESNCIKDSKPVSNNIDIPISSKDQNFSAPSDVSDLYEKVSPAVVSIVIEEQQDILSNNKVDNTIASGFIVNKEKGIIITNDHVVCTAGTYKIVTKDGQTLNVTSIIRDQADDLAILKVDVSSKQLPASVSIAKNSDQVKPGQFIVAIGNPLGNFPTSITTGVVSGIARSISASGYCNGDVATKDYYSVFQISAPINPGNSGGPLLNINGEVIGVNSATNTNASNISFAIPSNRLIRKLDEYLQTGKLQTPFLGVNSRVLTPDLIAQYNLPVKYGAVVIDVVPDSPASKADIKKGDIITNIDNKNVDFALQALIVEKKIGDEIEVKLKRKNADDNNYTDLTLKVKLADRNDFVK
jgi:S1-C subfamily serine protease